MIPGRLAAFVLVWLACAPSFGGQADIAGPTGYTDSNSGKTALMKAARRANNARIEALIAQGADVNQANGNGGTPIMYAALSGKPDTVALLLEHDARADAVARNGWTALMIASVKGYVGIARLLLKWGADANRADVYAWTPLMRAVYENRPGMVRLLVEHGATRVNQPGENGVTALHLAALRGDADMVRILLANGADPDLIDNSGRSALDFARKNNNLRLLRMMDTGLVE